jgi:putative redox protein
MDLIRVVQQENQAFELNVRTHKVVTDMAVSEGGQDQGFRPTELMVAALGGCLGKAIARYCQTIKAPSDGIELYLTYEMADEPRRVKSIVIDIELPEGFPEERKKAIMNVVKSCPVHNTLKTGPEIDVNIDDD